MSNPLAIFRKHQKILLVVFGVALMFVFTIGGIISQWLGTSAPRAENAAVVKLKSDPSATSFETLRETDMQNMRYTRLFLRQFMRRINGLAVQAGATPQRSLGIPDSEDERSLLQTMILSQKAEEMGMVVSDNSILNFLLRYTDNRLVPGDFERELRTISQGRMSTAQFFNAMRKEMLALRFIDLFNRGIYPATPAASWDYFQRLNRRVRIEAVPFNVTQYLDRVPDPSDAEIEKTYEAGKDRYSLPSSPEPGFKRRKKIGLQYVKADLEPFLNEEKEKITAEAIEIYYNDNKEQFRNIQLPDESEFNPATTPSDDQPGVDPTATDGNQDATQPEDDTSLETDSSDTGSSTTDTGEESTLDTSDAADESGTSDDEDDAGADESGNECGPLQDEEDEESAESDDNESDDNESDETESDDNESDDNESDETESDETESDGTEDSSTPDDSSDQETAADDSDNTAASDETQAAPDDTAVSDTEASADTSDAETEPLSDSESEVDEVDDDLIDILNEAEVSEGDANELGDLPDTAAAEAQAEFKSLEEVTDQIRTELATALAAERMERAINAVRSEMRSYHGQYIVWDVSPDRDTTPEPTPPNLQEIAAKHGLTAGEIPLVNVLEVQETDPITGEPRYPISQSFDENFTPFARLAFGDDLRMYDPRSIRGQLRDLTYLYWKTNEVAEETPSLEQCRDEVVRDLKMKSALSLAKKDADAAAQQLRQNNQTPKDAYRNAPDRRVIEAGPFSWMSQGSFAYMPPQISRVEGIEYPGNGFMKEVFQLQQGETGVAVNNPENVAYLVYLKAEASNINQLRDSFFRTGYSPEIVQLGLEESREMLREWYLDYEKKLGVEWLREAMTDSRVQ